MERCGETFVAPRVVRDLHPKRLEKLFHVKSINLGRHTGGTDMDGKPGDDGIKVFLLPTDAEGSVIKVAGSVTIQLFDLATDPGESNNVASQHHEVVRRIERMMAEAHTPSPVWHFR